VDLARATAKDSVREERVHRAVFHPLTEVPVRRLVRHTR